MAISKILICNMALSRIGANSTIESLDDGSSEANECKVWYDHSLEQTLAAFDWSFARTRLALTTHADDPPDGIWAYRYEYPTDAVMIRKLENPSGKKANAVPYEIELSEDRETKTILTNLNEAKAVYTFKLTQVTLFSTYFIEMLSLALASHIAYTLTGKETIQDKMAARFETAARIAPAINANEIVEDKPREAEHITGRA